MKYNAHMKTFCIGKRFMPCYSNCKEKYSQSDAEREKVTEILGYGLEIYSLSYVRVFRIELYKTLEIRLCLFIYKLKI
jgi:hypothetical protein